MLLNKYNLTHRRSIMPYGFLVISVQCYSRYFTSIDSLSVDQLVSSLEKKLNDLELATSVPKQSVDIMFKYKSRLSYILKQLEIEAQLSTSAKKIGETIKQEQHDAFAAAIELQRPKLPEDGVAILTIDIPGAQESTYTSGKENFNMAREFDIIILDLVNDKFKELQISKMFQLLKFIQLDKEVADYVQSIRDLYIVVLRMDSLVFEAEVPRHLFEDYIGENIILKESLKALAKSQDTVLHMYKSHVLKTDIKRKELLESRGPVLQILRLTQKDLPREIYRSIIQTGETTERVNENLKKAMVTYKLSKLKELKTNGGIFIPPKPLVLQEKVQHSDPFETTL